MIETIPFENEQIKKSFTKAMLLTFNLLPSLSSKVLRSTYSKVRKSIYLISPF